MCSGSETRSYLRLIDFVYHSLLGLRVIKRERETAPDASSKVRSDGGGRRGTSPAHSATHRATNGISGRI